MCAAMIGLENAVALWVEVTGKSDAAGGNQDSGDVGQYVAEEIGGDDHVEAGRVLDQFVGHQVDVHEGWFDSVFPGCGGSNFAPQRAHAGDAAVLDDDV